MTAIQQLYEDLLAIQRMQKEHLLTKQEATELADELKLQVLEMARLDASERKA